MCCINSSNDRLQEGNQTQFLKYITLMVKCNFLNVHCHTFCPNVCHAYRGPMIDIISQNIIQAHVLIYKMCQCVWFGHGDDDIQGTPGIQLICFPWCVLVDIIPIWIIQLTFLSIRNGRIDCVIHFFFDEKAVYIC